jgi:plastocyanin
LRHPKYLFAAPALLGGPAHAFIHTSQSAEAAEKTLWQASTKIKMYGTVFTNKHCKEHNMPRRSRYFSPNFSPIFLLTFLLGSNANAAEQLVDQKDKQFSKKALKIKVGDAIEFRNSDPFAHNIFSLSDTKSFDLGSYPQGQSKKVTFDKPGKVEVECSIHPGMQMVIEVEK